MEKKRGESGAKQRWNAGRKRDVVLRLMRGEAIDAVSREVGIEIYRLEEWRKKALEGMETALKSREGDPLDEELKAAKLHIGELSMEVELLRKQVEMHRPLARGRSRK